MPDPDQPQVVDPDQAPEVWIRHWWIVQARVPDPDQATEPDPDQAPVPGPDQALVVGPDQAPVDDPGPGTSA